MQLPGLSCLRPPQLKAASLRKTSLSLSSSMDQEEGMIFDVSKFEVYISSSWFPTVACTSGRCNVQRSLALPSSAKSEFTESTL